jgi:hypothetical protein
MGTNYPWTNGLEKAERILFEMTNGDPMPETTIITSVDESDVM